MKFMPEFRKSVCNYFHYHLQHPIQLFHTWLSHILTTFHIKLNRIPGQHRWVHTVNYLCSGTE